MESMESMESHEAGFPPFPHSLEIPSGFPHSHGLDDWIYVFWCPLKSNHRHRKGLVTDVSGPQRNACPGTLTSEEGLVSLLGAERMRSHFVIAVAMGPALRAGTEVVTKLNLGDARGRQWSLGLNIEEHNYLDNGAGRHQTIWRHDWADTPESQRRNPDERDGRRLDSEAGRPCICLLEVPQVPLAWAQLLKYKGSRR